MELSDLNFKQVLVVLTKPNMRIEIINYLKEQEIDLGLKFVDSYMDGAKMVQRLEHDPYDFIIVDKLVNNAKSKDFIEFITVEKKETKILTFSSDEKLNYL
jgi:DNA-binding NarL/FixJ family response regulator